MVKGCQFFTWTLYPILVHTSDPLSHAHSPQHIHFYICSYTNIYFLIQLTKITYNILTAQWAMHWPNIVTKVNGNHHSISSKKKSYFNILRRRFLWGSLCVKLTHTHNPYYLPYTCPYTIINPLKHAFYRYYFYVLPK